MKIIPEINIYKGACHTNHDVICPFLYLKIFKLVKRQQFQPMEEYRTQPLDMMTIIFIETYLPCFKQFSFYKYRISYSSLAFSEL